MSRRRALLIPSFGITPDNRLISQFPTGLYSLKEACAETDWEIDVLNLVGEIENEPFASLEDLGSRILSTINSFPYDLIGFSTMGGTFPLTIYMAECINQARPDVITVLGGPHASFLAEEILNAFQCVDAVVIGEGEITFAEMLRRLRTSVDDWKGVPGVMARPFSFVPRELQVDLDRLPILAYPDVRRSYFKGDRRDQNEIEGVRGCFARCRFCSTTQFWENRVRRKSAKRLVGEMTQIAKETGLNIFHILGDNFTTPVERFRSFCRLIIERGHDLKWKCSCRIGDLEREDILLMKDAGCTDIFVGIESASAQTLERLNKRINLENTLKMIRAAIDSGITITASQIIGFPWETREDVFSTLRQHTTLLETGVKKSIVNTLFPLAGAEGFPDMPVVMAPHLIERTLPNIFSGEYAKQLIFKHPKLFGNFGYYKTEKIDKEFLMSAVETSRQITAIVNSKKAVRR